jgi:hypothetical protein
MAKRDDDSLEAKQKEQLFHGLLKSRLILLGYTVAVPEPDIGEDLWIANRIDRTRQVTTERIIYRAQLKSARPTTATRTKKTRTYETNDYTRTLSYAIEQPRFVYIFGIVDDRLSQSSEKQFHIGCVPALFWKKVKGQYPDAGTIDDRYGWQIKVTPLDAEYRRYQMMCNIRRAANFDLSPFFEDLEYGFRVASGAVACPEPIPIPDRDGGKRRSKAVSRSKSRAGYSNTLCG